MLETMVTDSPLFDNCFVVGADQKFASAIITVNQEQARAMSEKLGTSFDKETALVSNTALVKALTAEVEKTNSRLAAYEAIKKPCFVFDEWSSANGLLSQTLKLKRKALYARYKKQIADIFE